MRWETLLRALAALTTLAVLSGYLYGSLLGAGFAIVEGRSMEPLFHTGDLVILEEKQPGEIGVGDIIVYEKGGKYIIHRVIYIYKTGDTWCYVTKGDNNPVPDLGITGACEAVLVPGYGLQVGVPYEAVKGVVLEVAGIPVKVPYVGLVRLIAGALGG